MNLLLRHPLPVLGLLSALSLAMAYVAQYGFNLQPCELCLWQRVPFYLVIAVSLLALPLQNPKIRRLLLILALLCLLANAGLAAYHTGVEQQWWPGPSACSNGAETFASFEELREHILSAQVVRCDQPALELFGFLTMASANVVFCLGLAFYALIALRSIPSPLGGEGQGGG